MKTANLEAKIEISQAMWEKLQLYSQLHDFYSPLLTDKQNTCFTMHYLEDMSLAEVGEALGITPQAVADQVKRTVKVLRNYEDKLSLIQNWQERQEKIKLIETELDNLSQNENIQKIKQLLSEIS